MRVLITGVTGFVGGSLASHLLAKGHVVRGTSSKPTTTSAAILPLRLGQPVDSAIFEGIDVVVHAAHDLSPGSRRRNVDGTVIVAQAASARGVGRQIFISSYSAHPGAVTEYALTKVDLESFFISAGYVVVRPGLVIGRGGLYARLADVVRARRLVPVVYPRALVPVVAIDDLAVSIGVLVEQSVGGLIRLYRDDRVTMAELMSAIRQSLGSRALFFPIPYPVALAASILFDAIGVSAPLRSDNLRALRANQAVSEAGDLSRFVRSPRGLGEMIDAAR